MKKAFTLIELMISVVLLSLIVTFLYHALAQLQNSNAQFIKSTQNNTMTENSVKLLYNDFFNAISIQWLEKNSDKDVLILQTSNSLHNMTFPYVIYRIYKDEQTLRRIESPVEKVDYVQKRFRFNAMIKDVKTFRVYEQKGHYLIYLKADGMREIVLDIVPPALLAQNKGENQTPDTNTTQGENNATQTGGFQ